MIPAWSEKAKSAKSAFYREWNDIDVYIEDTGIPSKKIARLILTRCFEGKYKVSEIFPLGGRKQVIDACEKDNEDLERPRIYVIDGDFYLIVDAKLPENRRLYSLPFYCIENLLIDKSAITEFLYDEDSTKERDEINDKFDYDGWIQSLNDSLVELFIEYAICNDLNLEAETVAYRVHRLSSPKFGYVDRGKIDARLKEIKQHILKKISEQQYSERKLQIIDSLKSRNLYHALSIVSGKDYLLPLLRQRIRTIFKVHFDDNSMNIRLAKYCDTTMIKSICSVCENITVPKEESVTAVS